MIRYFFRRILLLVPVIIAVSFIVFTLMDLAPGDRLSSWDLSDMSLEEVAELRASLGLDDPFLIRYGRYMLRLVQGDLGSSDTTGMSVWKEFSDRLPNTLLLASCALVIGVAISIPMGILAARRAGKVSDNVITGFTMIGMSMPGFWLGILILLLFSYQLGWFPSAGFRDGFRSVVLPAFVASTTLLASTTRQTRSSMLEVLGADYLRTARAKGVPEGVVIRKHALGNALIPIVTNVGLGFGVTVAGTAVTESVFAWPGIGRYIVESVTNRDVTATTGSVIMTTVLYVTVQLLVDFIYALIDPRIKAQYTRKGKGKGRIAKPGAEAPGQVAAAPFAETAPGSDGAPIAAAPAGYDIPEVTRAVLKVSEGGEGGQERDPDAVRFVTRDRDSLLTQMPAGGAEAESGAGDAAGGEAAISFKKRSQAGEVIHHLSRNPGAIAGLIIILLMLMCYAASYFIPFTAVTAADMPNRFSPPTGAFPFGTDGLGRNQFVRVIYAARFSLPIGIGATAVAAIVGVMLGSLAGYYEGTIGEEGIMRFSDTLASIPGMLLGMVIITILGRSLTNLIIAVGVSAIPHFIRTTRASVLSIKGNEFVEASRAIGLSSFRIVFTQILPNGLAPVIVQFTTAMGVSIIISASLSFLGFGVPVPNPEWGALVSAGRDYIRNAPWLTTFPGLFIMMTVMAFNLLGDGFRDAFDPKLKRR
ncbi:MAG: ABC transporter permease subunit [Clostridiales bacterium]|nr:ABC transporter permease subunit [Clostridiales bacterium]